MDSHNSYRDTVRPLPLDPRERGWGGRDDTRPPRDQRDNFFRGRSPGHDRRERRRSRSPVPVDRYEPRTRIREDYPPRDRERDDRSRRVGDAPANIDRYVPGQESAPLPFSSNPMKDPSTLNYQVGFSYYGEWWRINDRMEKERERMRAGRRREPERPKNPQELQEERERERAQIQAAYDEYKERLQAKMAREFTNEHKKEQWFRERYVPEVRDGFRQKLSEHRRGLYHQWEQDLDTGFFDEFSLEGVPKAEANGAGGTAADKDEGETTEVMGVGDLVATSGADIRDENLFQPTLLIKTIAPHVSRANLESFCKEHLGEGEGGFKWLSLSDPNPSKRFHRIGWVILHPSSGSNPVVVDRSDMDDDEDEGQLASPVTVPTAEKALEAINSKTVKDELRGDFVCHVGVHNPSNNPRRKALWDLFSSPDRIERDISLARRLVDKFETELGIGTDWGANYKIAEKVEDLKHAEKLQPVATATAAPLRSTKRIRMMDLDAKEADDDGESSEEEGAMDEDADEENTLAKKKQLDLTIEYLRRVFNFCFFCVFESDSVHELTRKCPGGHLRRPRSSLTSFAKEVAQASANGEAFPSSKKRSEPNEEGEIDTEGDKKTRPANKSEAQLLRAYNWVKTFEDKIMQILEPENVDIRKLGGRSVEEALTEELAKYVKQEDENKWRCKVPECTKLFKEDHFWRKHVEKRHVEWLDAIKQDFELVNAYVLDPAHIAPSRTDANSNGHFPQANGLNTAGTPRGFNLQSFTMNGMLGGLPNFGSLPGNFPPLFSGNPGHPHSQWPANGSGNGDESRGPGGPIRRGGGMGGRGGPYRSGPYDRRQNPRWDPNRRGGGSVGGPGNRWGDGAAGGAAMGPREAILGRSIKSYEDLDQASGHGGGELNY